MRLEITLAGLLALAASSSPVWAAEVSSISQYGITWTLDRPHEAGQFGSGDWWVVGPVTISAVSPTPTGTRNGSSVNPMGGRQGYDDRGGEYDTSDNVSFPYTLELDQSLVSSVSKPEGVETHNVGCLQSQAVLTALSAPPPDGTLRPAYAGTYKRYFNVSQINWRLLPNLPAPGSRPAGTDLLRYADRPHIDHMSSWTLQHSCAQDNWINGAGHPCYGRDYAHFVSDAAQYVMLDTPKRNELTISLIQLGIDNYGVLKAGGKWFPAGGHHSGRKWPVVFAARMLNDCDMLQVGADYGVDDSGGSGETHFSEDGHTYYGLDNTALFGWDCASGHGAYFENGCSGSGAKDCRDPASRVDACPDYRNCCTSGYWVGQALAALMLQSKTIWNHDAFFDYLDRWMTGGVSGGGSASSDFVQEMWTLYRDDLPPEPPAAPGCAGNTGTGGAAGSGGNGGNGGTSAGGASGSAGAGAQSGAGGQLGSAGNTGAVPDAGLPEAGKTNRGSESDGGCSCNVPASAARTPVWLAPLALLIGVLRRRALRRASRR